ncbi:xanthine dehydrogenase [Blastochloris viridis]|uniref:Selenium-dependent molybdenum hydroxylase systemprotein, YqeB family n=1 Tax=Blastochloris viridis TaxID=1079 RepID=A0A0H5BK74_BLAVI|nr:xanthine dehydrogenase [Blastochloris viridis]ALK09142.1 hypothetical protein BVIR_1356 [Blastochloris viridis]BAS00992.1 xanthine and CO dehydrogenases maturation factor [Blastochloris viridis]CUU41805.1 selenium-dependent molybdenum hydroxylase systemprotein, YqeB family [Blastochloris viridis]
MPLRHRRPLAVILGTNEIASAVAVFLHRQHYSVVLSYDPNPPVIRRGMAFHDVLYDDPCQLEGVVGQRAETWPELVYALSAPDAVAVTRLGLTDLIVHGQIAVLVDARMQKYAVTPDLRHLAGVTVGLGPGFRVGFNCDVAVETRPANNGKVVDAGTTDAADGIPSLLGEFGRERLVYSDRAGRWRTAIEIGTRVFRGFTVGHLDGLPVAAPLDGMLRGVVRDGLLVPARTKLLEVDPRGRKARWTGIDERPRAIAFATLQAVRRRTEAALPRPETLQPATAS